MAIQPAPEPETYEPEPEPVYTEPVRDKAAYLAHVHSEAPETLSVPNSNTVELGDTICEVLRTGGSVRTIVQKGLESGLSDEVIVALVTGAAMYLCPDQVDNVRSQVS